MVEFELGVVAVVCVWGGVGGGSLQATSMDAIHLCCLIGRFFSRTQLLATDHAVWCRKLLPYSTVL